MIQSDTIHGIYGTEAAAPPKSQPMHLSMLPCDLKRHWGRCGITANFLATSTEIPSPAAASIISTVINEILENSVKYSAIDTKPIDVELSIRNNTVECEVKNWARLEDATIIDSYFKIIHDKDIEDLYFLQLEKTATDSNNASQIGLLGVMHDYPVTLGCRIQTTADPITPFQISVKAKIYLNEVTP